MTFFTKTVAEHTKPGQRQDVEEKSYTFHAYGRTEGVTGMIISDGEYPALVAHQLLSKVVDEFLAKHPRTAFSMPNISPGSCQLPQLKEYITKYQDPSQADSIMKIQRELDETKITLHKTIESVLERGEKIDSLVQKSDGLSAQSKMFYTQVGARSTARMHRLTGAGQVEELVLRYLLGCWFAGAHDLLSRLCNINSDATAIYYSGSGQDYY